MHVSVVILLMVETPARKWNESETWLSPEQRYLKVKSKQKFLFCTIFIFFVCINLIFVLFYSFSSENDARKRWKQLRDYFLKILREPQKSGSAGGVKRKWYLYDRMLFVKAYTGCRQSTTNMEPLSPDDDTAAGADVAPQNSPSSFSLEASGSRAPTPLNGSTAEIDPDILTHQESSPKNNDNINKRPKRSFPQERASQGAFETEMIDAAKRLANNKKQEISEEEHFFLNLVPKLQQMSPLDRMECRGEIHMVVLKYMKRSLNSTSSVARHNDRDQPHLLVMTPIVMGYALWTSITSMVMALCRRHPPMPLDLTLNTCHSISNTRTVDEA